jgi:CHAT domain-containing protein
LEDKSASLVLDEEIKANIRHYFEGVSIAPEENKLSHAINLDHSVGRAQISQGKFREAYQTYQKVLAISYREGSLMGIGIALNIMADLSSRANNLDEALFTTLLAYKVAQAMKNKEEMGVVELSFARMLKDQDPSLSVMWLLRAKENLKDSRYKEDYVRALPSLAQSLRRLKEDEKASKVLEEAWGLAQSLGSTPTHKWTKWEVAIDFADDLAHARKHEKAIEVLQGSQAFFAASEKSTETYTSILYRLARSHAGLKHQAEAGRYYLSAYANYELTRANAPGEEARAQLDRNNKGLVDDFVDYHLQSKDFAAALALLESNKARTLNDIFEDPSYKQTQDQWKEMERRHAKEVTDLLESPGDELLPLQLKGHDMMPKFFALRQKQDDERRTLQTSLQLKEMTVTRSLSKEHVEEIRRRLPSDVAVLSFFIREERAALFVIGQRGVQYVPLAVDTSDYHLAVQQLRVALTNPHNDFYREPAQWLFKKILGPGVKVLPKTVRILVYSPDGLLSRIPLGTLRDGEKFLGDRYAIYRIPSLRYATSIREVKAPPVRSGILCVDPDISGSRLPFQQETGRAVEKLYGESVTSLVGKDCSERKLVAAIKSHQQPTFLHMGAHGNFYPVNAMDSAVWLSPEEGNRGQVQAWNAKAMATVEMKHVDLVTLSSCESGLTDPSVPRDVFGIARAFFFAGVKRMVAPLWAVHDQATAEFMQAFHTAYGRKMPAVLALQEAQRALMKTERYRHPFYWSAFVLTGAAR